jgi:glutamate carboxypeptidase
MALEPAAHAALIAARALPELEALVGVSSPSGDLDGAEAALALCASWLPHGSVAERVPCSTPACAPDLIARLAGTGRRRLLLLGHVDTVVSHDDHAPLRRDGDRLFGPGTVDMKGGVVLSLGVARALAQEPGLFAELGVLLVTDEEWRTAPFLHVRRFAGYDACLCFEAGEQTNTGADGVVVRRKGAGTLRVEASGRAAHSGSAPQMGVNALLALCEAAIAIARTADPAGPEQLTVTPTVIRSGEALNVVPASGELLFDMRSRDIGAFARVQAAVPAELGGARLRASMERVWPAMDARAATAGLLDAAAARLGRPIVQRSRGGASDASHFAPSIPLTVDGLGPRGGGAHTPDEFVSEQSLHDRAELAVAVALAALEA